MIYADNAATTKPSMPVIRAMNDVLFENWGNPSGMYERGFQAKKLLSEARAKVANAIGAEPEEIYFTSGGTEANNWALRGAVPEGGSILTSSFEHHSIIHTCWALHDDGHSVILVDPKTDGIVDMWQVNAKYWSYPSFVTIMAVNNELGTIQPIKSLAKYCKERGAIFHTDAVQAIGNIPIDVKDMGIDLLSLSGHKFHAPQGVGALYIRNGVQVSNLLKGGQQESRLRPGTENLASIVGMGVAIENAIKQMEVKAKYLDFISDHFITTVLKEIADCRLNGHRTQRIPGTVNLSFKGVEGQTLVLWLGKAGICASAGSACASESYDPSHVISAIKVPKEYALGSIRFSFGIEVTPSDIEYVISELKNCVEFLRGDNKY